MVPSLESQLSTVLSNRFMELVSVRTLQWLLPWCIAQCPHRPCNSFSGEMNMMASCLDLYHSFKTTNSTVHSCYIFIYILLLHRGLSKLQLNIVSLALTAWQALSFSAWPCLSSGQVSSSLRNELTSVLGTAGPSARFFQLLTLFVLSLLTGLSSPLT